MTPFEPEWEGHVTLEISNTTPLPAKIYANEGIAQVLFFQSDEPCEVSYEDKKGKYQAAARGYAPSDHSLRYSSRPHGRPTRIRVAVGRARSGKVHATSSAGAAAVAPYATPLAKEARCLAFWAGSSSG